jgi:peptidoglycan/LPS O-acetylase OafA/YrhL
MSFFSESMGGSERTFGAGCAGPTTGSVDPGMAASASLASTPGAPTHRDDIDGLRAVSVLLVVAFHAGVTRFAGGYVGVDVFFVLSGFLITGLLVAEHERTGRVSLREFVARRVRRLLPMASIVIVATLLAGWWLLPPLARDGLVADARAAVFYVANWRYAGQATAYSDTDVTEGLLVHFWSLAIEEQFYVFWPLLVVLVGLAARRLGARSFLPLLAGVVGLLVAVSFWLSVTVTADRGPEAYYLTHVRVWELAAGAALALALPHLPAFPRAVREVLAAAGLVAIVGAAMVYDTTTPFPGTAALAPVLGAMALILAGRATGSTLSWLLGRGALTRLGRWSYSWYLWHWPAIGVAILLNERAEEPISRGTATALAVVVSLGLAVASHHWVENPIRHARPLRVAPRMAIPVVVVCMAVPLLVGRVMLFSGDGADQPVLVAPTPTAPSTEPVTETSTGPSTEPPSTATATAPVEVVPMTPRQASADEVTIGPDSCHQGLDGTTVDPACVFGDPSGGVEVVVVGDSHARQWVPAFDAIGRAEGWRVHVWTKSACAPIDADTWYAAGQRVYTECREWLGEVVDATAALDAAGGVDAVIVGRAYNGLRHLVSPDGDRLPEGPEAEAQWAEAAVRTFGRFAEVADEVIVLRDTPWPGFDIPTCLSEHRSDPLACGYDPDDQAGLDDRLVAVEREAGVDDLVDYVDPTPLVCPGDPCPAVVPTGAITYRDTHHLTARFALELADRLGDLLVLRLDP